MYITSYNQKEYLKQAIDSVLQQTFMPFEILVIDDASTDGSQEVIHEYVQEFPTLIRSHFNETNVGITKSRNRALSLVKGDYITSLDGDDMYLPKKLEIQKELIANSNANLAITNFYYAEDTLENCTKIWCNDLQKVPNNASFERAVLIRDFPDENLFRYELFDRKLLDESGHYDENLSIYEDYDFRIRMAKVATPAFSLEPLSIYRLHSEGLSRKKREVHSQCIRYIYNKHQAAINVLPKPAQAKMNNFLRRVEGKKAIRLEQKKTFLQRLRRKVKHILGR
ncbi:glycosyltransferase family 2 protein [Altibacter sp. HG106]|uniref:glycosyltransferase family 2 protein n=1 Tax=Altibacter sp. HG106 TaxID=3023937 RepID=UPI002350F51D|nr:glycosyltransferase family 2 protein [Altibacter sp. HG106]MDC7995719.1 glycosyltransferase family 2 protein [Altibacter sp. HG106]